MSAGPQRLAASEIKHPDIVGVARSEDHAELELFVPEELLYFRGHFPGFAILPGVVQLDWAIQYGREHFVLGAVFANTIRIKFRKPIRPNHHLTLKIKYVPARNCIYFDYADAEGACSSGQVGFAQK
jgi:3-hydroxymyristoyl/3-hydroxydecanoyl-(acyl carrier protein) dehydratase